MNIRSVSLLSLSTMDQILSAQGLASKYTVHIDIFAKFFSLFHLDYITIEQPLNNYWTMQIELKSHLLHEYQHHLNYITIEQLINDHEHKDC
jgi:hypothetical protein